MVEDPAAGSRADTVADIDAQATAPGDVLVGDDGRIFTSGATVGRYQLTDCIGRGGMGVVFAGYDPELDRKLAIKVLHRAAHGSVDSMGQSRMVREARAMAKLTHPNVVTVHDVGTHEGRVFLAMEYVDGQTLTDWMRSGNHTWRQAVDVFAAAGDGLVAAHRAGLIHRDFKPDNVMIASDGRVLVMDFGLARPIDQETTREHETPEAVADWEGSAKIEQLTRTGALVGTPAYMAGELYLGHAATEQSDQFAFCVALHQALYGARPFAGDSVAALAFAVARGDVVPAPPDSRVPPWLRKLVLRGLEVEPEHRWLSMAELLGVLRSDRGGRRRNVVVAATAVAAVGVAGVSILFASSEGPRPCTGAEQKVAAVWNDARRDGLATAFASSSVSYAGDTWKRVASAVEHMTSMWALEHVDACEATVVHQSQSQELMDLRIACLDRRLRKLDAVLDVLSRADAKVIGNAVRAVSRVADLRHCADSEILLARVKLPDDPVARDRVEQARAELTDADALKVAGDFSTALEMAEGAANAAQQLGYEPLEAEAKFLIAELQSTLGDPKAAEQSFVRAYWAARGSGHDEQGALAAIELIALVGAELARHEDGDTWAEHARAEVKRLGNREDLEARMLDNLGLLHIERHDLEAAGEVHRKALAVWERIDGPDQLDVAVSVHNLGNVLFYEGELEPAMAHYERVAAIWERALGPRHPQMADALNNLGNAYHELHDFARARAAYERAVSISEAAFGPKHPALAAPLNGVALVLDSLGEREHAVAMHRRVLALVERSHGSVHPFAASTRNNLGGVLYRLNRYQDSLAEHRRALEIREQVLGVDHPVVSESATDVGLDLVALGRPKEALAPIRRGLKIREEGGAGPKPLMETRFALARALWDSKTDRKHAIELAESAREVASEHPEWLASEIAEIDAWLAQRR